MSDEELTAGLVEAQRRLSAAGMHDARCPEPDEPCNCGIDAAIFGWPAKKAKPDKRRTCSCGHRYGDHATGGGHCLAASTDPDQRTGQECECYGWTPLTPA